MPNISQDGKNRCVRRMETTSFQTSSLKELFVKAASINKESAESSAALFVAQVTGEKWHWINYFPVHPPTHVTKLRLIQICAALQNKGPRGVHFCNVRSLSRRTLISAENVKNKWQGMHFPFAQYTHIKETLCRLHCSIPVRPKLKG